ncbi:MAG: hypothetical protein IH622_13615 [Ochrobactrum anthropi]|uniref:Uncharacterized protein n=1 Tax=Brucella anthropi TaxID=529 RepID=A0A8I0N6Z6_BRUAN|nr:hypothetical protein [Brucella anthropi]MBE0561835.1 hypothetical protein [Brucella anthropi]
MKIGDRQALDAEREFMRDQFDAVWQASETIGRKEERAIRCAISLDAPRIHHRSPNWTITPYGRFCGPHNAVIYA